MNIAFDVKGTLDGQDRIKNAKVLDLLKRLHDAGHTIYVWSNSLSYAIEMVNGKLAIHNRDAYAVSKYSRYEAESMGYVVMDLAFEDDTSQDYLAAKRFIWVHDIPYELEAYEAFAKALLESLK